MRPWRLTRRARVEMEAALMALRGGCVSSGWYGGDVSDAMALLAGRAGEAADEMREGGITRRWRILRARVALALRAALRADEDARCEEARRKAAAEWPDPYDTGLREAAAEAADILREWPALRRNWPMAVWWSEMLDGSAGRVPRALWEVAR